MNVKAGEIWEVEFGARTEKVVVVADHGSYATILKLNDEPRETRTIILPVFGMKYAEPGLLSYKFHEAFETYIRDTTEAEFADIMGQVKVALNIVEERPFDSADVCLETEKNDDLKAKLEGMETEISLLRRENESLQEKEKKLTSKYNAQIEEMQRLCTPEEQIKMAAERDLYKRLYEQTLERLIAGQDVNNYVDNFGYCSIRRGDGLADILYV